MPKIKSMFCFVVCDKDEDDEGVPAVNTPMGALPLLGADIVRIEALLPHAQRVANAMGLSMRIMSFTTCKQIGEIHPQSGFTDSPRCQCGAMLTLMTNHAPDCPVRILAQKMIEDVRKMEEADAGA